jgi:hypothetical protein
MTSIQWDSQQFYRPPPPAAIPSPAFWPPSHSQAGAGSIYFQPSIASARFEEVKRTTTHGAAQKHITSSSDQVELPPDQGQSLQGIEGMCPCFFMTATADQMQKSRRTFVTVAMQLTSAMQRQNFLLLSNSYYHI